MSSYPILDNKPIDQWKVVELKEELKKRKLSTKGLKDHLIKRLDEAICAERENDEKEMQEDSGNESGAQDEAETDNPESVSQSEEKLAKESDNAEKMGVAVVNVDSDETVKQLDPPVPEDESADVGDVEKVEGQVSTGSTVSEIPLSEQDTQIPEKQEIGASNTQMESDDMKHRVVSDDLKPPQEDAILDSASRNNQVSEVIPNVGFQVKSNSVSSASLSINEKNELKDNIIVDNAKLELDVSKPEMVEPSSNDTVPVDGKSHPMDVEVPHEIKIAVEDKENNHNRKEVENMNNETADIGHHEKLNLDLTSGEDTMEEDVPEKHVKSKNDGVSDGNQKNDITVAKEENLVLVVGDVEKEDIKANQPTTKLSDMGDAEKLNLDQISGEDTMEEDASEKHVELKHEEVEVSYRNEKIETTVVKEETTVMKEETTVVKEETTVVMEETTVVVGDNEKDDKVKQPTTLVEKRKLNDQGGNGSNEPVKRQRKWKTETLKVPEPHGSSVSPLTTPKEQLGTPTLRRNFSRSDSTASDNAPKERVVPPSQKPLTDSLRIDNFLRPFTLKAVEELLGKTGSVKSFWMDHIKTHCYVTYSSVEEAVATRDALYNLQWPPNGGRLLVADFVDHQEVESRIEAPKPTPIPTKPAPPANRLNPTPAKQQLPPPPPPPGKERGLANLPPPPPMPEKVEPTILTLDVLFKKTKATPRIYYLPLSEEQVAAKLNGSRG